MTVFLDTNVLVYAYDSTSYWDALIVAAAERAGADTLSTEDLSDGQAYGSVRVENPFASL